MPYKVNVSYKEHDRDVELEGELALITNRKSSAGGYSFYEGARDLQFEFENRQEAIDAVQAIRALAESKDLELSVTTDPEDLS